MRSLTEYDICYTDPNVCKAVCIYKQKKKEEKNYVLYFLEKHFSVPSSTAEHEDECVWSLSHVIICSFRSTMRYNTWNFDLQFVLANWALHFPSLVVKSIDWELILVYVCLF